MQMKTIRLLRRHTHAGKEYEPPTQLVLNARTADWLIEQGVAEAVHHARSERPVPALLSPPEAVAAITKTPVTAPVAKKGRGTFKGCCGWNR